MFTAEENELLTRVGPGTPMGELIRRYWIPALLSEELPEPDCPPVRTRLLGEDLVAFRDTQGRVGLLDAHCSHRRAPLFFGRNEEGGLRCIYHGWKYDIEGNILETPAEPVKSHLKDHLRHKAYPCVEINGLVMTYMGPPEKKPLIPDLPWLTLPREQVGVGSKMFLECNWLQALEGDSDSVHSAYLHRRGRLDPSSILAKARQSPIRSVDIDILPWGVRAATIYPVDDERSFIRTNTFLMPCIGNTPRGERGETSNGLNGGVHTIYQVPADDYSNWRYDLTTFFSRPVAGTGWTNNRQDVEGPPWFIKKMNRSNDYLIDRNRQKSGELYCGLDAGNNTQDAMVTEGMGPITDRTKEHLAATDLHIIQVRRFLLKALRDMQEGADPPGVTFDPAGNKINDGARMITAVLSKNSSWKELLPKS